MIDSAWFYEQLASNGRSVRDLARFLDLDPSSVSRMLRGERKMSAEEQDGVAKYLGLPLADIVARRRGEAVGLGERGLEPLVMDETDFEVRERGAVRRAVAGLSFYDRVRGCMKGTISVAPGVDLSAPTDPDWAKVYDD
ncbi:helix-turn-helix domain-containing protein [Rhizobium sp. YIM 134829]|uniref:helix-turn-helix domain-containing protein n=1 Tax=Rhizobium sp. YIM 134829 TaxID=3390453 RepID=UPI00397A1E5D